MASGISKGILWSAIDRFGVVLLQFVINLVLARLLTPDDFGLVGMILIFVVVSQTLIDSGFGSALIQKLNPTQTDYSTVFWWNLLFSILLYAIIHLIASGVASFYHNHELAPLLRVIALVVIINSFSLVQKARLKKSLSFDKIAITDIISYSVSAVIAFYLAKQGMGAWSLVFMQIANAFISAILFWSVAKWTPSWSFSLTSLKNLFSYGGFLLIANMMQDICTHIQGVVIGRNFSAAHTGLYTQAKKMDEVASMTIPAIFCNVLFPVYSEHQNDKKQLCYLLGKNTRLVAFIVFPLMMLLIIIAEPLFNLLYGDKWLAAVPYFQILCIGGFFSAVYNLTYYAVAAAGKSKALFYWGCYKWGVLLLLLIIGATINMTAVLFAMVISNFNIYITNALLARHYIKHGLGAQIQDTIPIFLCTLITGGTVCLLRTYTSLHWIITSIVFLICYLVICYLLRIKAMAEFKSNINITLNKFRK